MNDLIAIDVARLDGYLTGIVSLNGHINEYYAGAFLIKKSCNNEKLESSLIDHYSTSHRHINFSKITEIGENLGILELEIQCFIAEDILGCAQHINSKNLFNRKKYISFKIMDMIDFLILNCLNIPSDKAKILVHKVEANFDDTNANYIFLCISFDNNILILLFKHNA